LTHFTRAFSEKDGFEWTGLSKAQNFYREENNTNDDKLFLSFFK